MAAVHVSDRPDLHLFSEYPRSGTGMKDQAEPDLRIHVALPSLHTHIPVLSYLH